MLFTKSPNKHQNVSCYVPGQDVLQIRGTALTLDKGLSFQQQRAESKISIWHAPPHFIHSLTLQQTYNKSTPTKKANKYTNQIIGAQRTLTDILKIKKLNQYECIMDQKLQHIPRANDVTRARRASAGSLRSSERRSADEHRGRHPESMKSSKIRLRDSILEKQLRQISARSDLKRRSFRLF